MPPSWLTPGEFAEQMHVHHTTVRKWIHEGRLPAYHHGPYLRIDPADAEAFKRTYSGPVVPLRPVDEMPLAKPPRRAATA